VADLPSKLSNLTTDLADALNTSSNPQAAALEELLASHGNGLMGEWVGPEGARVLIPEAFSDAVWQRTTPYNFSLGDEVSYWLDSTNEIPIDLNIEEAAATGSYIPPEYQAVAEQYATIPFEQLENYPIDFTGLEEKADEISAAQEQVPDENMPDLMEGLPAEVEEKMQDVTKAADIASDVIEAANGMGAPGAVSSAGAAMDFGGDIAEATLSSRVLTGVGSAVTAVKNVLAPVMPLIEEAGMILADASEFLAPIAIAANLYAIGKDMLTMKDYYQAWNSSDPRAHAVAQEAYDKFEKLGAGTKILDAFNGESHLAQFMKEGYYNYDMNKRANEIRDQWKKMGRGGSEHAENWVADENLTLQDLFQIRSQEQGHDLSEDEKQSIQHEYSEAKRTYWGPINKANQEKSEREKGLSDLAALPQTGKTVTISPGVHSANEIPPWLKSSQPVRDNRQVARTVRQTPPAAPPVTDDSDNAAPISNPQTRTRPVPVANMNQNASYAKS
jgi:hypothetical protein